MKVVILAGGFGTRISEYTKSIPKPMISAPEFLKEGMKCIVLFNTEDETPMSCDLPQFIECDIVYTEPGLKGDTATNAMKPAKLDCGDENQCFA